MLIRMRERVLPIGKRTRLFPKGIYKVGIK